MEVISTTKGKPCAHHDGYTYRQFRKKEDGTITWRCLKERSKRCRGILKSRDGAMLNVTEHTCGPPDDARVEVQKRVHKAKKRAREDETSIQKIYAEELGDLHNKGYDFVTEMPTQSAVKRNLYRHRSISQGNQKEPNSRDEVILDDEILKMEDGSSFLLKDNTEGERIIILSGKKGKESLKLHENVFMDGTFKSASKQFSQIYTIHADYGSSKEETNIHPVLFALLPDKKKDTYVRLFREILKAVPEWTPRKVTVDFEGAAVSALKEVFPSTEINGCFFHMKKCIWRKVQELGLARAYRENEELRLHIRMCTALAFLRPEDVPDGWLVIQSQAPDNSKLVEFFDYFVNRWLENEEIPIHVWTCYKRRHRTTNAVEGWNNRINNILGRPNPKLKDVLLCLKREAESSAFMYMRAELNLEGKRRKTTYQKLDERIEKTINKYEASGDITSCLKALSYMHKLE